MIIVQCCTIILALFGLAAFTVAFLNINNSEKNAEMPDNVVDLISQDQCPEDEAEDDYDYVMHRPEPDPGDCCNIVAAKLLPGWNWHEYGDGSGYLEAPDGKSYFDYDLCTHEYQAPWITGNNWRFFDGYPYEIGSFSDFKEISEKWIVKNVLAEQTRGVLMA